MRRLFEVALLFLLFVPSAHAAEPCASLSADAKADYLAFGENAASAYDRADFAEAVRFILR
ncbi:MAG: hypothetical protein RBU37_23275, partial [Myxococcota bacterium]|nr:hypothetical protein [Myxococcota bacterium]